MKKVSIIIPTYNQEKYICQAVESALAQDYSNLEIVVSDDNSTDNTEKILKKYLADPRFRYFKNEANLRRVGNYHKALYDYATGDYVLNVDGDDYLTDNYYISEAVEIFQEDEAVVLVFARQALSWETDVNSGCIQKRRMKIARIANGNEHFINYYKNRGIPHATALYDREEAMRIGYYNQNIVSADWESELRLILGRKVGFIDKYVAVWRNHASNASKSFQISEIINNIIFIEAPYKYALQNNFFSKGKLNKWKKIMLHRFFAKHLIRLSIAKRYSIIIRLLGEIKKTYPFLFIKICFDPRIFIFLLLAPNRSLIKFAIVKIIGREDWWRRWGV